MSIKNYFKEPFVIPAAVLGIGLILAALVASYTFYAVRGLDNTLSITGSATENVKADMAKWTLNVSRSVSGEEVQTAYSQVQNDANQVVAYFKQAGISSTTQSTIYTDQDYSYNGGPKMYNVHETITVQSNDVEKIQSLSLNINTLIARGVIVAPQAPEYYVTNLPALRVSLLGKAVADAKERAQQLASSGGASVGKLKSASSGVVQVMAPNSTSVDDYGSYDTSTIDKTIMVTARATFLVR